MLLRWQKVAQKSPPFVTFLAQYSPFTTVDERISFDINKEQHIHTLLQCRAAMVLLLFRSNSITSRMICHSEITEVFWQCPGTNCDTLTVSVTQTCSASLLLFAHLGAGLTFLFFSQHIGFYLCHIHTNSTLSDAHCRFGFLLRSFTIPTSSYVSAQD